ncbi:serine hydrolase [Rhodococcus sp. IEGM 1409]|uniref:serine hydrolase n=1 Tax=Rhodococcus sp. IEGM 1409 TaxID=3047082 RepID=UPI0024B6EB6C|nr:serine hydrolase [Rhodococcus sp. IEGM 1409]
MSCGVQRRRRRRCDSVPVGFVVEGVVALSVGRATTLGLLGLDDRVGEYIGGLDQEHADITVRQLLTQSSGLDFSWGADIAGYYADAVRIDKLLRPC